MKARGYHGPQLVASPAEIARVLHWAHAERHPDEITTALREKAAAALAAHPSFRQPLR